MLIVISYDIADDRRRTRLAELLEGYGARVQESVFEADLTVADYRRLLRRLRPHLDPSSDSIRVYHLSRADAEQTLTLGLGSSPRSEPVYEVL